MAEPGGGDPRPKPNGPKTEGLEELFKPNIFERKKHEQGHRLNEQRRDALIAVQDSHGRRWQFIIQVTLDLHSKHLSVVIEPTSGVTQAYPELRGVRIIHAGQLQDSVEQVVQAAFEKMAQAGYSLVNGR